MCLSDERKDRDAHAPSFSLLWQQVLVEADPSLLRQMDHNSFTPLALATQGGHHHIIDLLAQQCGAAAPCSQTSPSTSSASLGQTVAGQSGAGPGITLSPTCSSSPLVAAARQADEAMVRSILTSTTASDLASNSGQAMLEAAMRAAVVGGSLEVLRLLLTKAIVQPQWHVDDEDESGETLLMKVSRREGGT